MMKQPYIKHKHCNEISTTDTLVIFSTKKGGYGGPVRWG